MNLRQAARGMDCFVRLEDICLHHSETVVLAYIRLIGVSGIGMKSPDCCACPACHSCHDAIDRRAHLELDRDYVRLAHLEGVMRWQAKLVKEGKLSW
jgi:hypothetical protein